MSLNSSGWIRPYAVLIPILLLAFGLRLYELDDQSLWWDELKTIERALLPLPDLLIDFINTKDQLPIYFLAMRGWIKLGNTSFFMRLFSVFWGVLGVAAIFPLGRQITSAKVGVVAAFLLAISPFHVYYSQEARMYSFLPTLLILAHVALFAILQGKGTKFWSLYFVAMGTAVFTHYFAFLIVLAHTIFFVLHLRPFRPIALRWLSLMTILAVLFLPWAVTIGAENGYSAAVPTWILSIRWFEPLLTLWTFSIGATLAKNSVPGLLGIIIFGLGFISSFFATQELPKQKKRLLWLWLLIPMLLIYLISLSGSFSLYVDRYLIVVLPVFLLLVAWGWVWVVRQKTAWLLGLLLLAATISIPSLHNLYNDETFARNDWQATFALLDVSWGSTDTVIGTRDLLLPLNFYGQPAQSFIEIPPPEAETVSPAFDQAMTTQLINNAAVSIQRFWFIEPFYIQDPHQWPAERNAQVSRSPNNAHHQWLKSHFQQQEIWRFPGVRLTLYSKMDAE